MSPKIPAQITKQISNTNDLALYELSSSGVRSFIASTPQTRSICNNSLVCGLEYTQGLSRACANVLKELQRAKISNLEETHTTVLHILRGGLNFGVREALGQAFGWNRHGSSFISAQRARAAESKDEWIITEGSYRKIQLSAGTDIVFGDVVATGTSLAYALNEIEAQSNTAAWARSIVFLTIGGWQTNLMLEAFAARYKKRFPEFKSATAVYFEGVFAVPDETTKLTIKETGTDLVRLNALLAPEFIASQSENPVYPIERCAIYDAGSRAFDIPAYLAEVSHYWKAVHELAKQGMTYDQYLQERMPNAAEKLGDKVNLLELSRSLMKLS